MQCPSCRANLDVHRDFTDGVIDDASEPRPGDNSICFHCMSFNVYELDPDDQLVLRRSTVEEVAEFKESASYKSVMQILLGHR